MTRRDRRRRICGGRHRSAPGTLPPRRRRRRLQPAGPKYDLLLRGGHVIDARNKISAVRDVAIADGKIAAVDAKLNPADALKTVDVSGLYVTPGLIDIHAHTYAGTGERGSYAGDNSLYPDGYTFRVGVTTVADAGCAGWRNFEDFKQRVIDRVEDPHPRLPQHRRQRHARREVRAGSQRHGGEADRRHGEASIRG